MGNICKLEAEPINDGNHNPINSDYLFFHFDNRLIQWSLAQENFIHIFKDHNSGRYIPWTMTNCARFIYICFDGLLVKYILKGKPKKRKSWNLNERTLSISITKDDKYLFIGFTFK